MLGGFVDSAGTCLSQVTNSRLSMVQAIKRNEEGQIVVDENGTADMQVKTEYYGNVSPDFRMGFNTTFEFYKFRLSAVLDWKQGG